MVFNKNVAMFVGKAVIAWLIMAVVSLLAVRVIPAGIPGNLWMVAVLGVLYIALRYIIQISHSSSQELGTGLKIAMLLFALVSFGSLFMPSADDSLMAIVQSLVSFIIVIIGYIVLYILLKKKINLKKA